MSKYQYATVLTFLALTSIVHLSGVAATAGDSSVALPSGPAGSVCPVLDSRYWHAWIDRVGDASDPSRLNVSGQIDMPTPGFVATFTPGPMDRRRPPALRIRLDAAAPEDMVIQVIDTQDVAFSMAAAVLEYRSILITCGDKQLAEIIDVRPAK